MDKKEFVNELLTVERHLKLLLENTPLNDVEWSRINEVRRNLYLEIIAIKCNAYEVIR